MGKRPAGVELFEGNMASIQREIGRLCKRRIAIHGNRTRTNSRKSAVRAKAPVPSLAHHITEDSVWKSLSQIPNHSPPGVDGQKIYRKRRRAFEGWIGKMLQSVHRHGYSGAGYPTRLYSEARQAGEAPIGCADCFRPGPPAQYSRGVVGHLRARLSSVLCSAGGPGVGAHHALATLVEVIAGNKTGWVLEADLKNFFGSLDHDWVLQFVQHRVGDPRLISLIRRWLKAGVLEDGVVTPSEMGTPQGGSISVLLSNIYLHYVLDLWFERKAKPRLRGEAYLVRYIDDFVVCFQYREDALRVQDALRKRLGKFGLTLEPTKTKLVEFGRFAQRHAGKRGRKRPGTKRGLASPPDDLAFPAPSTECGVAEILEAARRPGSADAFDRRADQLGNDRLLQPIVAGQAEHVVHAESPRSRMRVLSQQRRICATMRATSSAAPAAASMFGAAQLGHRKMSAAEDVERQVTVAIVVATEEPAFLIPMHRV